jgi:hypothetical protein
MNGYEYVLTIARGFAPAARERCDVIELRERAPHSGQRDVTADPLGRETPVVYDGAHDLPHHDTRCVGGGG